MTTLAYISNIISSKLNAPLFNEELKALLDGNIPTLYLSDSLIELIAMQSDLCKPLNQQT